MSLSLVTPSTVLPVTLDEVAAHCRLDAPEASDQALVDGYIRAAAAWAFGLEGWTGRSLIDEIFDETFDGWARTVRGAEVAELPLSRARVRSVASVTYLDTDGASQTLAADQYRLVHRNGAGVIVPAYNITWPSLRDQEQPVTVRYTAGYGAGWNDVPHDLRLGLMQLSAWLWENRTMAVPEMFTAAFRKFQVNWSI